MRSVILILIIGGFLGPVALPAPIAYEDYC